jgi:hypothetical protein
MEAITRRHKTTKRFRSVSKLLVPKHACFLRKIPRLQSSANQSRVASRDLLKLQVRLSSHDTSAKVFGAVPGEVRLETFLFWRRRWGGAMGKRVEENSGTIWCGCMFET